MSALPLFVVAIVGYAAEHSTAVWMAMKNRMDRAVGIALGSALQIALVVAPAYLFATSVCATLVERGGPGYLNALVVLFFWNAVKFAVMGVLTPVRWLGLWLSRSPRQVSD